MRSLSHSELIIHWTNNTKMGFHLLRETTDLLLPTTMILTISLTLVTEYLTRGTTMLRLSAPMRSIPFIEEEGRRGSSSPTPRQVGGCGFQTPWL